MNIIASAFTYLPRSWQRAIVARYEGAYWGNATDRSWIFHALQDARADLSQATREELQRKSRYFECNDGLYQGIVDRFESYVAGNGLQMQPNSSDEAWNERAKAWWEQWATMPDATSLQSFGTLQGLMARCWFVDGEVFIRKLIRDSSGMPRVQLIEAHRCSTPGDKWGDPSFVDGVQTDDDGRPVRYWFRSRGRDLRDAWLPVAADGVIHLFEPSRPDQYRGLPFCHAVLNDLHDRSDLKLLEMKKAKANARVSNVIKRKDGALTPEALRRSRLTGSVTLNTGTTVQETRINNYRDTLGGDWIGLDINEDFQQHRVDTPSAATREYWKILAEEICTGCGIPLVIVHPDSMQGTVYRGSLDLAAAWFRARFTVLSSVSAQVYRFVMGTARYVQGSGLQDAPADWWKVDILPPRSVNVDVGYNAQAVASALENGTLDHGTYYAERNLDWREQFRKIARQHKLAQELGIPIGLRQEVDAYGVAVRAGAITPNIDDENAWRARFGLPPISDAVRRSWEEDDDVRRPITLNQDDGNRGKAQQGDNAEASANRFGQRLATGSNNLQQQNQSSSPDDEPLPISKDTTR